MSEPMPDDEPQNRSGNQPVSSDGQDVWSSQDYGRDERRQERELRRQQRWSRRSGGWIGGAILILLGIIFLLQNTGLLNLENWWALFILIPAFGSLASAWERYQESGQVDAQVRGTAGAGLVLALIAFAFLFNLEGPLFWPALLILAGVGVLVNAFWR